MHPPSPSTSNSSRPSAFANRGEKRKTEGRKKEKKGGRSAPAASALHPFAPTMAIFISISEKEKKKGKGEEKKEASLTRIVAQEPVSVSSTILPLSKKGEKEKPSPLPDPTVASACKGAVVPSIAEKKEEGEKGEERKRDISGQ